MLIQTLIASSVLMAALAACTGAETWVADQIREQTAVHAAESPSLADAQMPGFERAWRAAARE